MAKQQQFYDRVEIYADNIPYLPDGQIRNFSISATYNSKPIHGFEPNGNATGFIVGNRRIDEISWTEFLPQESDYVNWRTFTQANPNAVYTVVPISLSTNAPNAQSFAITGVNVSSIVVSAPSEGEVMTRDCKFNAITSSNL